MELSKDASEFLSLLNSKKVKYLIVGAWALALHGIPRYTGDIDILVAISHENSKKIFEALNEFGFGSLGIKSEDFLIKGQVIQLGYPPNRIDLLTEISGVDFEIAWKNKANISIKDLELNFLGMTDLIKNKSATGRTKDLADVESLQKIIKKKNTIIGN